MNALAEDLRKSIRGEVRFDAGSRALYSTDSSNYRQVPIGVVIPKDIEDAIRTVELARSHGAPILSRGGGTSLAGQCCNVALVLDFSKYVHRILQIDAEKRRATVEPGVVLDSLRDAAEKFHLTFGPDPATHSRCTLGGMIGNNSCGVHSVYSGKTDENVEELEILTYRGLRMRVGATSEDQLAAYISAGGEVGKIYGKLKSLRDRYSELIRKRYPNIPRRVSGYNLNELLPENGFHVARALVGSESTLVTVLQATLRLVESPPVRNLVVLGFSDIATAGDFVPEILRFKPLALEGMDDRLINAMKKKQLLIKNVSLLPNGDGWLLVEFGGQTLKEANAAAMSLIEHLKTSTQQPDIRLFENPAEMRMVWKVRESALGATAFVPGEPETWEGWEDSAVAPEKVGAYVRDLRKLMDKYEYACCLYGHFGHGCVHTRIDFDLTSKPGIQKFRAFVEEAADLVVSYGGSLSGEHGDGQSRAELLPKMFGNELIEAFREFKSIWDPDNKMNPGKVVNPYRLDENLRLGSELSLMKAETHFAFPEDESFAHASLRCVGVGECRKQKPGVMCPSYMATGEEMHSTRGRAHLLFEMARGDVIDRSWNNPHVKEALDLCLACKACKSECPVGVDMATYKAEFLSHYYENNSRPRTAYTMGLVHRWAKIGAKFPVIANFFTHAPGFQQIAKSISGIAPERTIPRFASESFRKWFVKRSRRLAGAPASPGSNSKKVILWPDTFNTYFHPEILICGVEVLEKSGFDVIIPAKGLCCGRPLYDYGMLTRAKSMLQEILTTMEPEITAGTPVVGLEPSCMATFRDELTNFFPKNLTAHKMKAQTFLLSEFLEKQNIYLPQLKKKALVHGHCHQRAIFGMSEEEALLKRIGLDLEMLDSGCCGMAGSFGFEKDHIDISKLCGERLLLPAVRAAAAETLVITNGFSCREQIEQLAGRKTIHTAEVLHKALFGPPESESVPANDRDHTSNQR